LEYSTKEAAVVFDVNAATVRRWLSGQRQPDKGYCLAAGIMNQMWQESGKPNILVIALQNQRISVKLRDKIICLSYKSHYHV
jgi:hypothetical protein